MSIAIDAIKDEDVIPAPEPESRDGRQRLNTHGPGFPRSREWHFRNNDEESWD